MPVFAEFERLWSALGLPAASPGSGSTQDASGSGDRCSAAFADLQARYTEPHRHYHNFEHIDFCLRHWADNQAAARWQAPHLAAAAIWFHDSIYDPHAADNEAQSADLAGRLLPLDATRAAIVHALIMDTCHRTPPPTADGQLFADIDLAGIGGSAESFAQGCLQIRQEYAWVPAEIYAEKRAVFLRTLLQRPAIYYTIPYRSRYEATARKNLHDELDRLKKC